MTRRSGTSTSPTTRTGCLRALPTRPAGTGLSATAEAASRQVLRTEYDEEGRAYQQYDGDDNLVLEVTYNTDGTTVFTDALGNQTTHTYDERDTFTASTNEESQTSSRGYDASFRPATLTDANDNTPPLT